MSRATEMGRFVYERYRAHRGDTANDGTLIPDWNQISLDVRKAWSEAAMEVARQALRTVLFAPGKAPDEYNRDQIIACKLGFDHITEMTRRTQRAAGLDIDGKCGPKTRAILAGWSPTASTSPKPWSGRPRSDNWRGQVYCLTVHMTGLTIIGRAHAAGIDPLKYVVAHYQRSTGTHYVVGYSGDIIQVASEYERAHGVGTREQRAIERDRNGWEAALIRYLQTEKGWSRSAAADLVIRWHERWAHTNAAKPTELFPSLNFNDCSLHVELLPLPSNQRDEAVAPGIWYTRSQHEAIARLSLDVARRNGFNDIPKWWLHRLFGHEDITPITRPGWDPAWLRPEPRFDWSIVYDFIETHRKALYQQRPKV